VAYLHLLAVVLYLGSLAFVGGLLIPAARRLAEPQQTLQVVGQVVRVVHPVALGLLGAAILAGAAMLTDLKAALRERYFIDVFAALGPKLLAVFLLALLNSYQFFGVGLRLTRAVSQVLEEQASMSDEQVAVMVSVVGRLQWCAWLGFILGSVALYLGLVMRREW
jgi:uncharacterized membrane protein